ncbi:MAG: response regulator transcription factor [Mariprofundaceae bacterium]|nr:response regulator transcription factor [Mariprofundaceae bacterium]
MANLHRVFIVEDESNTQELLCLIVADHPNLELVATAASLKSARQNLQQYGHHTDIFLVDLGLPDGSGLDFICNIRQQHPDVAIMVLSVFGDEHNVVKAIKHGANGYIHKDQEMDNIADHILSVMQGEAPISPSIAKHILNTLHIQNSPTKTNATSHTLTTRELDVSWTC